MARVRCSAAYPSPLSMGQSIRCSLPFRCLICATLLMAVRLASAGELQVAPSLHYFNYSEFSDDGGLFNRETGFLPGLQINAGNRFGQAFWGYLQAEFYRGTVDYDGQTQSGVPHLTDSDTVLYRLGGSLSYALGENFRPYLSLRYLRWDRTIRDNFNPMLGANVPGVYEQYRWWEAGVGARADLSHRADKQWLLDVALLRILNPEMEIDLENRGFGSPVLPLGEEFGVRAELTWIKHWQENRKVDLSLYYEAWDFGRSADIVVNRGTLFMVIHEPRSETRNAGARLTFTFLF